MPNSITAGDWFYHEYDVSRDLDGADPNCVYRKLAERPTSGLSSPAMPGDTANNARVFGDNFVTSYTTSNHTTGGGIVVNTAGVNDGSAFCPGYVARYVNNGMVHTVGEGINPTQAISAADLAAEHLVWGPDLERIINECKCAKK